MKPDLYTKAVLTVIAIMCTAIACNQYVSPNTTAQAQSGQFAGVQFSDLNFFDTRTGQVYVYAYQHKGSFTLISAGKLSKLGQPEIPLSVENGKER